MKNKEIKQKLLEIFGEQLLFNKDFDKQVSKLKQGMIDSLIEWCIQCKEGKELGSVPPHKRFKHLYVFFRKIGNEVRIVLIKEQNAQFIEIDASDHYYYDKKREKMGYKKSSYYGS